MRVHARQSDERTCCGLEIKDVTSVTGFDSRVDCKSCLRVLKCQSDKAIKKREWAYVQEPQVYGIACDICEGSNLAWSEYDGLIWCYDCKKDTKGTMGIFDGPVGVQACEMMGMCFDKYNIATGEVKKFEIKEDPELTGDVAK